jgi:hypothetical protein
VKPPRLWATISWTIACAASLALAQTLKPEEKFAAMMGPDTFSNGDAELAKLGGAMLEAMLNSPRLGENVVPEDTLKERVRLIQQWV